jgi:hypothetical protein
MKAVLVLHLDWPSWLSVFLVIQTVINRFVLGEPNAPIRSPSGLIQRNRQVGIPIGPPEIRPKKQARSVERTGHAGPIAIPRIDDFHASESFPKMRPDGIAEMSHAEHNSLYALLRPVLQRPLQKRSPSHLHQRFRRVLSQLAQARALPAAQHRHGRAGHAPSSLKYQMPISIRKTTKRIVTTVIVSPLDLQSAVARPRLSPQATVAASSCAAALL